MLDRRTFLAFAACTLATPLVARAQQQSKVHRIGWLFPGEPPPRASIEAVWVRARELGWIEGQNLIVEYRIASKDSDLLRRYAEDLVRLKVEIIVTSGTPATLAARNATRSIPIVFYSAGDPVGMGLVASLARPGGNVTGLSMITEGLDAKRLSLLREVLPGAQRVGELLNRGNPFFHTTRDPYEQAYRSLGIQPIFAEIADASELQNAIADLASRGSQALVVREDGLFFENRDIIMRTALLHKLPTFVGGSLYTASGALLGYQADQGEHDRLFVVLIDKILRGVKPADLPVEQPTKFSISINLRTARDLGLTIPQSLLLRADEVIQ